MASIAFSANTLKIQLNQDVGSVTFTGTTLANGTNHANVTTPPFAFVTVTSNAANPDNYFLQDNATQPTTWKTYTLTGPTGAGVVTLTDPDGQTTASFKK